MLYGLQVVKPVSILRNGPELEARFGGGRRPERSYRLADCLVGPLGPPDRAGTPHQHNHLLASLGKGRDDLGAAGNLGLGRLAQCRKAHVQNLVGAVVSHRGLLDLYVGGLAIKGKAPPGSKDRFDQNLVLDVL